MRFVIASLMMFLTGCSHIHIKKDLSLDQSIPKNCFPNQIQKDFPYYTFKEKNLNTWYVVRPEDEKSCTFTAVISESSISLERSEYGSPGYVQPMKYGISDCMDQFARALEKSCHVKVTVISVDGFYKNSITQ